MVIFDLFMIREQVDGNGVGVSGSQIDDINVREGSESSGGFEVDEIKEDLDDYVEYYGVEGYIEFFVDFDLLFGVRDGIVMSEGLGVMGSSSCVSNIVYDGENYERNQEIDGVFGRVNSFEEDLGYGLDSVES